MKKLPVFIFGILLPIALFGQAEGKKSSVSGQLSGNTIYTEISLRPPTREVKVVASAKIMADGTFSMDFDLAESNLYKLFLADNNYQLLILHPGDRLALKLEAANISQNAQVSGSQELVQFWDFGRQFNFLSAGVDSVETAWKENQKLGASDSTMEFLRGRYVFYDMNRKQAIGAYIRANPASLGGLAYIDKLDIDEHFELYALYDAKVFAAHPTNLFVQELHKKVQAAKALAIGSMAPDIRLPDTSGVERSLSAFRGKVVLIDFWAAWCGPCRKENPHVLEVYKKYHDKGFEVFGVSLDRTADAWKKAIREDKLPWTQVSDLKYWKSDAAKEYGVNAIPFTVLIDGEGKVIGKKLRGESLSAKLQEIFGF